MSTKKIVLTVINVSVKVIVISLIIIGIYNGGKMAYNFGRAVFMEEAISKEPGRDVAVTIPANASTREIGELLQEKGLIRDSKLFYVQVKLSKYSKELKPGDYILNTSMTAENMMSIMSAQEEPEEE